MCFRRSQNVNTYFEVSALNKLSKAPAAQRTTRLSSALIRANPGNAWLFNRQQQDAQELLQAVSTAIADEEEVAHAALESIAPMKDLKGATQDTSIVSCGGYQPELPPRLRNPQAGLTANLISCQICNFTVSALSAHLTSMVSESPVLVT